MMLNRFSNGDISSCLGVFLITGFTVVFSSFLPLRSFLNRLFLSCFFDFLSVSLNGNITFSLSSAEAWVVLGADFIKGLFLLGKLPLLCSLSSLSFLKIVSPTGNGSSPDLLSSVLAGAVTGLLLPLKTGLTLKSLAVAAVVVVGDGGGGVLVLLFPGLNTGLLLPGVTGWILLGLDSLGNGTSTALLSSVVVLLEPVKGLALLDDVVGFGILLISSGAGVTWVVVVVILIVVAGVVVTGVDVVVTTGIGSGFTF